MQHNLKNIIVRSVIVMLCLNAGKNTFAQSPQQIITGIYQTYDSLTYLTFDVKYLYSTDLVTGNLPKEEMAGTYTMAGKKARYTLGDIEFMQNDSFLIAVYHKEKFIVVSNPGPGYSQAVLPIRSLIDSVLQNYSKQYAITKTVNEKEETGLLLFKKTEETAQFESFSIEYNLNQNFLKKIEYKFKDLVEVGEEQPAQLAIKTLAVEFSHYRFDNLTSERYDENDYIFFENGVCRPVSKYKDFKVYNSKTPSTINQ